MEIQILVWYGDNGDDAVRVRHAKGFSEEDERSENKSAVAGMFTRNSHIAAPGRNCMTHRRALHDFPDMSQVSLRKNNNINIPIM
jgi:hypothetical protein